MYVSGLFLLCLSSSMRYQLHSFIRIKDRSPEEKLANYNHNSKTELSLFYIFTQLKMDSNKNSCLLTEIFFIMTNQLHFRAIWRNLSCSDTYNQYWPVHLLLNKWQWVELKIIRRDRERTNNMINDGRMGYSLSDHENKESVGFVNDHCNLKQVVLNR